MTVPSEMPEPTPEQLVARIAHGDERAFEALYLSMGPRVKGYLVQAVRDPLLAEEILQDVMLTLWRRAPTFDPRRASALTWIFTIARNRMIDRIRRRNRPEPDPTDPCWVPDAPLAADDVVAAGQLSRDVAQALDALPEAQREVLRLTFYERRTYPEIADTLQIALGTVKSRARLGFQRLRTLLETP